MSRAAGAPAAIELVDVSKSFKIFHKRHSTLKETLLRRRRSVYELRPALDSVTLTVPTGQSIGLIGRNGAGKSTMLKVIAGLLTPDTGSVTVSGRISTLLELGAGFQGEYSGVENVFLYGALMGLSRKFIQERLEDIIDFAGEEVRRHIDNPIKTYSSGMYTRLAFAVAVHVDPDILVVDEVLAVGDEQFQRKCFERANELRASGRTIVIVSHDLSSIQRVCERVVWVENGKVAFDGAPSEAIGRYLEAVDANRESGKARGMVSIEDVRLSNADGRAVDAVASGDGLTVSFRVVGLAEGSQPALSVRLLTPEGAMVMVGRADEGEHPDLMAGESAVECRFERLPLAAGTYRVEVRAADIATDTLVHPPHAPVVVAVLGPPVEGLVMAPTEWRMAAATDARSEARPST